MASSWDLEQGVKRLAYMAALPPGPFPPGLQLGPDPDPEAFLQSLRAHAILNIDGELLQDRMDKWRSLMRYEDADPWITLAPSDDLRDYEKLLREHYQCDNRALAPFVELIRWGPDGYMEATRILYHLCKDKDQAHGVPRDDHHSRWLKTACERALDALKNPSKWAEGPSGTASGASDSKGSWDAYKGSSKGQAKGSYTGS